MGYQSPNKKNLTVAVTKQRHAYVEQRAGRLQWSVSEFFRPWVDKWFDEGCPDLSELEAKLPTLPYVEGGHDLTKRRKGGYQPVKLAQPEPVAAKKGRKTG